MRGRGQIMPIYHKTKLNLRKDQKVKKYVLKICAKEMC